MLPKCFTELTAVGYSYFETYASVATASLAQRKLGSLERHALSKHGEIMAVKRLLDNCGGLLTALKRKRFIGGDQGCGNRRSMNTYLG